MCPVFSTVRLVLSLPVGTWQNFRSLRSEWQECLLLSWVFVSSSLKTLQLKLAFSRQAALLRRQRNGAALRGGAAGVAAAQPAAEPLRGRSLSFPC